MDVHRTSCEGELRHMTDATTGRGMEHEPAPGGPTVAPTGGTEHGGTESRVTTPGGITTETGHEAAPLFPHDESDKFELQLQHAVSGFVDGPRAAVEEADHVLEELTGRLTEAVAQRRRTLRGSWQSMDVAEDKPGSSTETEQLRLALRDYRELAERLLHV
ncbi:hypothetical protein J7F01_07125 [Streptomyces sp. ISL-22]|uniref:Uncharacterized protein n=2 Tax=Streptomyces TaxID=1883 RepID=A0A117PK06_9ACTN|nr:MULTISPECIES: hypothetical protein [Streptomyces]KUM81036.1 hypothetical protein AQI70_03315 [Streptomyces curacoi]MBT2422647.1 hypothetical protein [Streptomyces sp. ISL-24]MBT2431972.1 hypothetical protein [Streptomyces sp. ISL-22]